MHVSTLCHVHALTKFVMALYDSHSSSSVSATASKFSIFLMRFRPKDKILRFSIPDKLVIFSIEFVERANCLQARSQNGWLSRGGRRLYTQCCLKGKAGGHIPDCLLARFQC